MGPWVMGTQGAQRELLVKLATRQGHVNDARKPVPTVKSGYRPRIRYSGTATETGAPPRLSEVEM
ncbi:hypothetical protein GCM10011578_016350 [Streptomyces fuscichromogenes]|uniref:Uncharacterized protein n=1 Tax=Streptomyces fuscichromogenes TaxID=1324013 RepID=A0A917UKQ7_9ACTN|nr:hypothetical protein GCM10011578_016350 [Streptomyces fuscichromogenes]